MNDIEKKALALLNEVRAERGLGQTHQPVSRRITIDEALCRAIEQHEAFRQEVSDAVRVLDEFITGSEDYKRGSRTDGVHLADGRSVKFARFIVADPEPAPDALRDLAEELARESQDLNLPLRKRVDWFEAQLRERGLIAPEPEPDALREVVNDAWSNTISRLAFGEFKVSEAIGTMISGVNFDAMRDALTAELRARGVTAPARGEG